MNNLSLDEKLALIGIRLSGVRSKPRQSDWVDIEQTLYDASLEAESDSRLFMVLCSWVAVHGDHVIVEKLQKLQKQKESKWLVALAIFAIQSKLYRWKILVKKVEGNNSLSAVKIAEQAISYKGREEDFYKKGFLIPKGSIRIRESDVASRERLIKENLQYKNRFVYGANWRADIITAIQMGYENPYRISKAINCSYPSAHRVFNDYKLAAGQ